MVNHPQYNVSSQAYDFALLQMDLPVHHLEIQIWEESLGDGHDHEKDHDHLVGSYGYVTGIAKQGADSRVKLQTIIIELPNRNLVTYRVFVIGWGLDIKRGINPDRLQEVAVVIWPEDRCR